MTVEDRLARMEALLIGAWCANSPGDKFDADCSNTETVMRLVSMTLHEVRGCRLSESRCLTSTAPSCRKTSKPLCQVRGRARHDLKKFGRRAFREVAGQRLSRDTEKAPTGTRR
jgi:hypothetical protein